MGKYEYFCHFDEWKFYCDESKGEKTKVKAFFAPRLLFVRMKIKTILIHVRNIEMSFFNLNALTMRLLGKIARNFHTHMKEN